MNASEPTPDFLAARLALLAMRAGVSESSPLDSDRVTLSGTPSTMFTEAAAQRLAEMPKPLFCQAEVRDGTLFVTCRALAEVDASEQQLFDMRRSELEERGGFLGFLEEYYGGEDHLVKALGRGESLLVRRSVVELWSRDYSIRGGGHSADYIDNPWSETNPEYVEARRQGAKGILRFWWPDKSQDRIVGRVFQLPPVGSASASERRDADQQLIVMARHFRQLLEGIIRADSVADSTPSRSKWGEWQRKHAQQFRTRLPQMAAMMKQVFEGREMPADVAAFIEECEKYLGPQSQ